MLSPRFLALSLALASTALAITPSGFEDGGDTLVSAMMMFVGNEEKVYIMDKAEGNAAQIANHPAWASVWDLATREAVPMDVPSNVFCSSGMHFPNGSFATFGGNGAVGRGGQAGNVDGTWDSEYQDFDGSRAIRILDPCTNDDDFDSAKCKWFDDATLLAMKARRWYSTAEPTADGTIVLIGGFASGGYVNRNYPNTDPNSGGGSINTYEFFPAKDEDPVTLDFLLKTSGLNAYVHAFMMPSGKMFLQGNLSTTLWDYNNNIETPLPDMPKGVVRVYPASGAVAMLPLTPANNYVPTILFCGGSDMADEMWGNFSFPFINTWDYPASKDCQRITPEPSTPAPVQYEQDDDLPEGRSMGQFIILPDGKLLVLNGALNGTAGYSQATPLVTNFGDMPFGESLASGPLLTPAIYDPTAPRGKRWSTAGLNPGKHPRMYHSSAMLLPDASVLVAGSNPNVDVNLTTIFPTTYAAEIFYPPYFSASVRPSPKGIPKTLSYGGDPFDITIPASSYSGSANDAANSTIVAVVRGGFTTHAMNMGQRFLQLAHSYTVKSDGSFVLHVSQMPPNANIFQPGPAFVYVTVNGVPSNGTHVIVGSGQMGTQPLQAASQLPASVGLDGVKGSATSSNSNGDGDSKDDDKDGDEAAAATQGLSMGAIIGIAGGGAALALIAAAAGLFFVRRRRRASAAAASSPYAFNSTGGAGAGTRYGPVGGSPSMANIAGSTAYGAHREAGDSTAFVPLKYANHSQAWSQSTASLGGGGYSDDPRKGYVPQQEYGYPPRH